MGKLNIFISWSGKPSNQLAEALKEFIEHTMQSTNPFVSSRDIDKGVTWFEALSEKLQKTQFGILCLSNENLQTPWILFEAGALYKGLGSKICTILMGLDANELDPPLSQFNGTFLTEDIRDQGKHHKNELLKLLTSINNEVPSCDKLSVDALKASFNAHFPKFFKDFKQIVYESKSERLDVPKLKPDKSPESYKMQLEAWKDFTREYAKRVEELNDLHFSIQGGAVEYFVKFLYEIESNKINDRERIDIFAMVTLPKVFQVQKGPWPKELFRRYKKAITDKKILVNYVFCFQNEDHWQSCIAFLNEYSSIANEVKCVTLDSGLPLNPQPDKSFVLLRNKKILFTHKWDKFYGNMYDSYCVLNPQDFEEYSELFKIYNNVSELYNNDSL